jgi:hypothetical protein
MAEKKGAGVESGKEVSNIEAELQKGLKALKGRVGPPPSNKISTKGKKFTLPDGQSNTALTVIVADWRHVLAHYPGTYNANSPQDPNCFAVGTANPDSGQLVPHESSTEKQGEDCGSCPKNQWGSAPSGNGKACKNQVRLLLFGANPEKDTTPLTLYVSPSALKNWNAYVTELAAAHGLDVMQVVTEITFDPNETYPKLQFKMADKHAYLQTVFSLKQQHQQVVERPIELKKKAA